MTTTPVSPRPPHRPSLLRNQEVDPKRVQDAAWDMTKYSTRMVVAWAIVAIIAVYLLSAFDIHLRWPFGWAQ